MINTKNTHKAPYREASGILDLCKRLAWNLLPNGFRARMHRITELDEAIGILEAKIDQLNAAEQLLETKIDRLNAADQLLETKIEQLDAGEQLQETKIDRLQAANRVLETRIDRLISEAVDQLAVQRRLAALEGILADVSERQRELERALERIEQKLVRN